MKNKKSILLVLLAVIIALVYPVYSRLTTVNTDEPVSTEYYSVTENEEQTTEPDTGRHYEPDTSPSTQVTETTTQKAVTTKKDETTANRESDISENGKYYSKNEVALYIHTYGHLPSNFITKKEAQNLGWSGGPVDKYAKGKAIGGDRFGNYEGILPKAQGRQYFECDIDTLGKSSRGAKRIIFSNDGLVYYTSDHYESFTQLY